MELTIRMSAIPRRRLSVLARHVVVRVRMPNISVDVIHEMIMRTPRAYHSFLSLVRLRIRCMDGEYRYAILGRYS